MSIAYGSVGNIGSGFTSCSPSYPAVIAEGDLLLLAVGNRPASATPSTPSGWTLLANAQQTGGSGAESADSGTMCCTVFYRIADGTETGNQAVTVSGGNAAMGRIFRYTKTGDAWGLAANGGANNSPSASWSVTAGADPGVIADDMVFAASAINTDLYTYSAEALTQSGVTFGAATERSDSGITAGNDMALVVSDHAVSAGTSAGAPVYSMTASGSAANRPAGASVVVRMREYAYTTASLLTATVTSPSAEAVITDASTEATVTGKVLA